MSSSAYNTPQCVSRYNNLGKPSCDTVLKSLRWAMIVPKGHKFSAAEVADFVTALQNLTTNPLASRGYPLLPLMDFKDDSTEDTQNETAYGFKVDGKKGKYLFTFMLSGAGAYYWKKFRAFNGATDFDIIFADEDNVALTKQTGDDANPAMGMPLSLFKVKPRKVAGSEGERLEVQIELFNQDDLNENLYLIYPDTDIISNVSGLIDVVLTQGQAPTTGHLFIKANEEITGTELGELYGSELADPDAWVVTKAGVAQTVSAVSYDSVNGWFNLSCTATGSLVVSLATPAALAVLGIGGAPSVGYESNTLAQTGV